MAVTDETLLIAADARRRLQQMTDAQVVELTRAWIDAWDTLAPEFQDAMVELLTGAEVRVPYRTVARNKRLAAALRQARATLDELAARTEVIVTNDVATAVLDAVDAHVAIGTSQLPPTAAAVGVGFDRLSPGALDAIVNRTTEQIHSATRPLPADVVRLMKSELVRGVAVGDNPRETARRIVKRAEGRFNGGLARAATISRVEMLDAGREAARQAAIQNKDILRDWVWSAQLDARTCPSCLANHGTVHDIDEFGPIDHQQGRCARIDRTKTWKDLGFNIEEPADVLPDAKAWFDNLEPDSQKAIMGPGKLKKLQDGDIGWDDLTRKVETPGWRSSMHNVPLKDL